MSAVLESQNCGGWQEPLKTVYLCSGPPRMVSQSGATVLGITHPHLALSVLVTFCPWYLCQCLACCSLPAFSVLAANTWRSIAFIFHSYRLLQPFFLVGKVQVWSCFVFGSRDSEKGVGRWDWAEQGSSCSVGVWRAANVVASCSKDHWGGLAYRRDSKGRKSF